MHTYQLFHSWRDIQTSRYRPVCSIGKYRNSSKEERGSSNFENGLKKSVLVSWGTVTTLHKFNRSRERGFPTLGKLSTRWQRATVCNGEKKKALNPIDIAEILLEAFTRPRVNGCVIFMTAIKLCSTVVYIILACGLEIHTTKTS